MPDRGLILSVDDNEAGLYARNRVLTRAGFTVHPATTGQEGLDFIAHTLPDLILLDVKLPDISGIEVCRQVKSDPRTAHIPLIQVSSTYTSEADQALAFAEGADVYLVDPTPAEELVSIVKTLLRMRRSERALNERLFRFSYVADAAPVLLWAANAQGVIEYANQPWLDFADTADAEALHRNWLQRVHPEDRARIEALHRSAVSGVEERTAEFRFRRRDGEYRWLLYHCRPLSDEQPVRGYVGSCVDISDRKHSEQQITRLLMVEQALSGRLQQVATTALAVNSALTIDSVLNVIADAARYIIGVHQTVTTLLAPSGRQQVKAVQLSERFQSYRSMPGLARESLCARVMAGNAPVRISNTDLDSELTGEAVSDPNGAPPLRGWLAAPFIGRDGRGLGVIHLSHKVDETDFDALDEATLVQLASIASVALENARLYQELRSADQRKDEFLATLAHELRNPLAPIRNSLAILQRGRGNAELTQRAEDTIARQVSQMVRLIDDLLDISRITRNIVELRKKDLQLNDIVRSAVETSGPVIAARQQELRIALPEEPLWLSADSTRLAQVFGNLLNNASKFSPDGSPITISAERQGDDVFVVVEDQGAGIPPHMLTNVFEMFTQVERSAHAENGLGIGLTLVRHLVELHDGGVSAFSAGEGLGSRFRVRLPLSQRQNEPEEVAPAVTLPAARRTILVVDDNRDAAESLSVLLRMLGHDVRAAFDGEEALASVEAWRPQLIFLDIGLPRMNGYDVARSIRTKAWGSDVKLVALTGWGQREDQERAKLAGFDRHIVKPVAFEQLTEVLAQL